MKTLADICNYYDISCYSYKTESGLIRALELAIEELEDIDCSFLPSGDPELVKIKKVIKTLKKTLETLKI